MYDSDTMTALEAKSHSQWLAFGPILFQAARAMRDLGILTTLDKAPKRSASIEQIAEQCRLTIYGVSVLLDVGLSAKLVYLRDDLYTLTKAGYFMLHDTMTQVNMDFTQDICYRGMDHLQTAITEGRPAGLCELGEWETIYPALSLLTAQQQKSWFRFDHFYSDQAFPELLPLVFASQPKKIYDLGGNTGRWAEQCVRYDEQVEITIIDLPEQIALAKKNALDKGLQDRILGHATDLLDPTRTIPGGADIYWMSQFLDCFSDDEIVSILSRVASAMTEQAAIYILELFWDRQQYEAAALSLNCTSLYFTVLANGNSHFYHSKKMIELIHQAGLKVVEEVDQIGLGHTLLKCQRV
ncbi:methyltransferase [Sinobacterium caligoides]|uniref:methyltransferase n=1 Tax=Sinobacterium caligoides TaxID=933926 RepID=UPI001B87E306|nr:methyltransferase [Sinobacterium caligoides]